MQRPDIDTDDLPPDTVLAITLAFCGSELCAAAGKLELTRDRAGLRRLCRAIKQRVAAVGVAVMQFEAELENAEEERLQ